MKHWNALDCWVESYQVDLDLTTGPHRFASTTRVRFRCAEPGAEVFCDLADAVVQELALNGTAVDLTRYDSATGRISLVYLHSQFATADAQRVFARFDQPDLKATLEFDVIAPSDWLVVSNMAESSCTSVKDALRWQFAVTPLISTYLAAICAGPYHEVVPLASHGRRLRAPGQHDPA